MNGKDLRVVLLNTYETGGAARACSRLFHGLKSADADVCMIVRGDARSSGVISAGSSQGGFLRALLDGLPLHGYPNRQPHNFSPAWIPGRGLSEATRLAPDIVHLHWIPQGFVQIESLENPGYPVVWTLHDSWPFTGGCHLPGNCQKYMEECGACPVLGSTAPQDLSHRVWQRKHQNYSVDRMTFIAPSHWMAARAKTSSLLRGCAVEVIPNGIDITQYAPGDRSAARDKLGLPRNRRLILFGAHHGFSDRNKGFDLLCAAIGGLPPDLRACSTLVLFGESGQTHLPSLDVEIVNRGEIGDEAIVAALYRAADLLVVSSREENLPNMVSEAMACGLPCVAFDVGGIADQILPRVTGCLAPALDTRALSAEIAWLLENAESRSALSQRAREHAMTNFSLDRVARQHLALYQRLVESPRISREQE